MKIKIASIIVVLCFMISCASARMPKQRTIQNSFIIKAPFDTVWAAIIEVFADLQIPIENLEKDSGLIVTQSMRFSGKSRETDYFDCGGEGYWTEYSEGKFNVFLKKIDDNSCEMKVNCNFEGNCVSTGTLEKEIYERVLAILK